VKRYLLFNYNNYYPCGGMADFVKDFDSVEEILPWVRNQIEEQKNGNRDCKSLSSNNFDVFDQKEKKYTKEVEDVIKSEYKDFYF